MLDVSKLLRFLFGHPDLISLGGRHLAQKTALQKPSRLQKAKNRLENAVSRLEAAIDGPSMNDSTTHERVVALEEELRALKLQNTNFRTVNESIGNSLDKVIDKLKSVLKE